MFLNGFEKLRHVSSSAGQRRAVAHVLSFKHVSSGPIQVL